MQALAVSAKSPDNIAVIDVADPEPRRDEALVRVETASINRGELRLLARRSEGWRPGQDVAGTVVQSAADGSGPSAGTRVVAWVDEAGWAEFVAAPTERVVALADTVDVATACTLPVAGVTALRLLRRAGALLERRVLVTGAGGGVGGLLVELAARSGAQVAGITSAPERAEALLARGAHEVVAAPEELTGRFHVIFDAAGGSTLAALPPLLERGGRLLLYGNSSGEPSELAFGDFRDSPDATVEVFRVYESHDRESRGRDLERLVALTARGQLRPRVGLRVPYREAATALEALRSRAVAGKAVLVFANDTNSA